MLRNMSARHFIEWQLYYDLEPFGEERADLRSAQVVQTFINLHRDTEKHPKPFSVTECLLPLGDQHVDGLQPTKKKQTPKEVEMHLDTWIIGSNASILKT
jgi:hypothetical protein